MGGITKDVSLPLPFFCEVTILFTINSVAKESNLTLAFNRLLTNPESTYKSFFRDTSAVYYSFSIPPNAS